MDTTNSSENQQRRIKHGQRPTEPLAGWPAEFGGAPTAESAQPAATSGDDPAGTSIVQDVRDLFSACGFEVREGAGFCELVGSIDAGGVLVEAVLTDFGTRRIESAAAPARTGRELMDIWNAGAKEVAKTERLQKACDILRQALCEISQPADEGRSHKADADDMRETAINALFEAESVIDFGETVSERAASGATASGDELTTVECPTCNGHGLIGGHSGQTPESYEEHTQGCDDCDGQGRVIVSRADLAAVSAATKPAADLPRPSDDELWDATLRDRDTYHEWADKLAEAISKHFDAYIGEHSNANCPWAEALEVIEGYEDEKPAHFAALLPGPYYMDPPDGGSVSILEQIKRMAEDATQWRSLLATKPAAAPAVPPVLEHPDKIAAKVTVKLRADSGYSADQEARISATQWGRICAILAGKDATPAASTIGAAQTADQVRDALNFAANVIELFDDKTMEGNYMLSSGECAGIIRALPEYLALKRPTTTHNSEAGE